MSEPLSVAIAAVVKDGEILSIRRERGDYTGFWGLPGGKIELEEHVSEAARREIREECSLETDFVDYLGTVSEHLIEDEFEKHFVLHVIKLSSENKIIEGAEEGDVQWLDLEEIEEMKFIPSDLEIIENIVLGEGRYFECVIDRNEEHSLKRFEKR